MTCDGCKAEGKKFRMFPSKKRAEFVEQLCKKCSTLRLYEDARLEEAKRTHLVSADEGAE